MNVFSYWLTRRFTVTRITHRENGKWSIVKLLITDMRFGCNMQLSEREKKTRGLP